MYILRELSIHVKPVLVFIVSCFLLTHNNLSLWKLTCKKPSFCSVSLCFRRACWETCNRITVPKIILRENPPYGWRNYFAGIHIVSSIILYTTRMTSFCNMNHSLLSFLHTQLYCVVLLLFHFLSFYAWQCFQSCFLS